MEPVTHVLTGACLARTGFNRRAAYATAAMAIAAEFPDIDTLWSLRGPIAGFQHHRGITHTFVGLPVEAAFLLACFWLWHRYRVSRPVRSPGPLTAAPVRWSILYCLLLLALSSHLLLDYTNNYGIRPFFPFNPHWYAASLVFIFDPLLFLLLVAGLTLPALFALIAEEVGTKHRPFRGAGWARVALVCVVVFWLVRAFQHTQALSLAASQVASMPATPAAVPSSPADSNPPDPPRALLQPRRSLASPDPLSIFRWYIASDFGPVYTLATADTRSSTISVEKTLPKPAQSSLVRTADASHLGRVYLDWSSMPWVTVSTDPDASARTGSASTSTVTFQDLRFMGSSSFLNRQGRTPLTGTVVLNADGSVLDQAMDGRSGH